VRFSSRVFKTTACYGWVVVALEAAAAAAAAAADINILFC
jgi:hypothetical protein